VGADEDDHLARLMEHRARMRWVRVDSFLITPPVALSIIVFQLLSNEIDAKKLLPELLKLYLRFPV
jgi:hypothetical protein